MGISRFSYLHFANTVKISIAHSTNKWDAGGNFRAKFSLMKHVFLMGYFIYSLARGQLFMLFNHPSPEADIFIHNEIYLNLCKCCLVGETFHLNVFFFVSVREHLGNEFNFLLLCSPRLSEVCRL